MEPHQQQTLQKALKQYKERKRRADEAAEHLNDLCVVLAGQGFSLKPEPNGDLVLLPAPSENE